MASLHFELQLGRFTEKIRNAIPAMHQEIAKELYQFAEEVMADSKSIYVPVLTGALMNTGKVALPNDTGDQISVTLGYGDESAPYALAIHETMSEHDPRSWQAMYAHGGTMQFTRPGSGPKYLSTPLQMKQDQLPGRIRDGVIRALKSA